VGIERKILSYFVNPTAITAAFSKIGLSSLCMQSSSPRTVARCAPRSTNMDSIYTRAYLTWGAWWSFRVNKKTIKITKLEVIHTNRKLYVMFNIVIVLRQCSVIHFPVGTTIRHAISMNSFGCFLISKSYK
jgi:hypothetical protein